MYNVIIYFNQIICISWVEMFPFLLFPCVPRIMFIMMMCPFEIYHILNMNGNLCEYFRRARGNLLHSTSEMVMHHDKVRRIFILIFFLLHLLYSTALIPFGAHPSCSLSFFCKYYESFFRLMMIHGWK